MKYIIVCLMLFHVCLISAQDEDEQDSNGIHEIEDFSDRFYAEIEMAESVDSAQVVVYSKETKAELVRVDIKGVTDDLGVNVFEPPYGRQSVIMYEDFNFDGEKDFAIRNGYNSCYGGPSYQIYLVKDGVLVYSEDFTELGQNYCGMFMVNQEEKLLYTMTKSDCCWHQYKTYDVVDDRPRTLLVFEEGVAGLGGGFMEYRIDSLASNNKMVSRTFYRLMDGLSVLLSFSIAKNGKQVVIFDNGNEICYAFLKSSGDVEFAFPDVEYVGNEDNGDAGKTIEVKETDRGSFYSFRNKGVDYYVYDEPNRVGVRVKLNGKVYDMKGDMASRKKNYEY